jgi:tetratricopeptide (TPR) repeat protein
MKAPFVVLLLALTAAAASKPNPYLAQAKVFFQGGEYKQCLKRLEQAEHWDSSVAEQAESAMYNGLCKFNLRRATEAKDDFALALKLDPKIQLPELTSPKIVQLFESIPRPEPEAAPAPAEPAPAKVAKSDAPVADPAPRAAPVPAPANESPTVVEQKESPSRVGPIVLGAGALVAVVLGGVLGEVASNTDLSARSAHFQSDAISLHHSAEGQALGANISYAAAGLLFAAGLIWWLVQ